jgi:hypothetical protein
MILANSFVQFLDWQESWVWVLYRCCWIHRVCWGILTLEWNQNRLINFHINMNIVFLTWTSRFLKFFYWFWVTVYIYFFFILSFFVFVRFSLSFILASRITTDERKGRVLIALVTYWCLHMMMQYVLTMQTLLSMVNVRFVMILNN